MDGKRTSVLLLLLTVVGCDEHLRARDCTKESCSDCPSAPDGAHPCPHASFACHDGDVYWQDGCGCWEEVKAACGDRGCRDATCNAAPIDDPQQCGLARGQPVDASSSLENALWNRGNVVDGLIYSAVGTGILHAPSAGWNSNPHDDADHVEWVAVDLGQLFSVNRVDLYPRTDEGFVGAGFPVDFEIQVSTDALQWTTVVAVTDMPPTSFHTQTFRFPATKARFVRVWGTRLRKIESNGLYRMIFAELDVCSGEPQPAFHVVAPAYSRVGESVLVQVVRIDALGYAMRDRNYLDTLVVESTDAAADLPASAEMTAADQGRKEIEAIFHTPGLHTVSVTDGRVIATSNVFRVTESEPATRLFFGDIHVHTPLSDGIIPIFMEYDYARETACLDFTSVTDHDAVPERSPLTLSKWEVIRDYVRDETVPGRFVAILAYEWTNHALGHKNVYYFGPNGTEGKVFSFVAGSAADDPAAGYTDPNLLWQAVEENGVPALVIPHHVARDHWAGSSTDWSFAHAELQRLVEIFSVHGSYESCTDTSAAYFPLTGVIAGRCVQDALGAYGQRLGIIASGDNHLRHVGSLSSIYGATGHNGLHWSAGLAGVFAADLTRASLYEGMKARHTYATTGDRIFLEMSVDGQPMGSEIEASLPHSPQIQITYGGTAEVTRVDVLKYDDTTGVWTVPFSSSPDTRIGDESFTDTQFAASSIYYCRIKQDRGPLHEEPEMAWSSPVWIDVVD